MKRKSIVLLSAAVVILSATAYWVEAQQNGTKQQRREQRRELSAERRAQRVKEREERTAAYVRHIDSIVLSHNFIFRPNSMQRQPAGSMHILTNPAFEVAYYSSYIDVYIPFIKGIVPPYYPVVFNYVLPSVNRYTTVQNDGGWTITFDSWLYSGNNYTFTLNIYSASGTAILDISSTTYSTVSYSGYITQVY